MPLLSVKELSREISVPTEVIQELIERQLITPYGGRARLGEPRFSSSAISRLRKKIEHLLPDN